MSKILFRQIATGAKLVAIGNFFKAPTPDAQWRLAALFENSHTPQLQNFATEMSCVLAVGREFPGENGAPYRSSGFKKTIKLPATAAWQSKSLKECPRLSKKLAGNPEIASQRCFFFEADGIKVWLPKFEMARKLYFHAAFLARAAFEPNGLDMAFTIFHDNDDCHIHTPAKTGAPSQLLKIKEYRGHLSWLLLNRDVKRSFESIWHKLNQEQTQISQSTTYRRWQFDFDPPASLAGSILKVRGPYDHESNEILVWEIEAIQGLKLVFSGDVYFHHPSLKKNVLGKGSGISSAGADFDDVEIDSEEDPSEEKEQQLIYLPVEGLTFDTPVETKIAYTGERKVGRNGKETDSAAGLSSYEMQTLGVADAVNGGSIAPGEFEQLADRESTQQFLDRFTQLSEIINQIIQEYDINLLKLEVNPLPAVARCSYHLIDNTTPRCYLLAHFRLKNGIERFLLEMDTSDSRKPMSTRVFGLKSGVDAEKNIERFLKETVKGSLRWPKSMSKHCENLQAIHHPKETATGCMQVKITDWKQRICEALR